MRHLTRVLATTLWLLAAALPWPAAAAGNESPRSQEYWQRVEQFDRLLAKDRKAALAFAIDRVNQSKQFARDDPRRADALELLARASLGLERFKEALSAANEVVRIRRLDAAGDPELLAGALDLGATALFANDRIADADALFAGGLVAWRKAFSPPDVRLAEKLEGNAEFVQKGFGRTRYVIELLREAIAIRRADATSSRNKLAESLHELAIHEMVVGEFAQADADLVDAGAIYVAESRKAPGIEEIKAEQAQVLVMRAGLAARMANKEEAVRLAHAAQRIVFTDRVLQAETRILAAAALTITYELTGDIDAAVEEQLRVVDIANEYVDLINSGALDAHTFGDAVLWLGNLYLEKDDLVAAREALALARKHGGDTSDVLFAVSELARKSGDEAEALKEYQRALRERKENASEVQLMFGTSRMPATVGEEARFGAATADRVRYGSAAVLVPGGQYSDTGWLKLPAALPVPVGQATNAELLLIRSKHVLASTDFHRQARLLMAKATLYPKSALVYVHGFNITFDQALQRGAQLARDLNFDGPVFVFSWPSQGAMWKYGTDRASSDAAVDRFVEFVDEVEAATGAEKIHFIAHSMGNRVLLAGLARIAGDAQSKVRPNVGEIILAAPAVPEAAFSAWLDSIVGHGMDHVTLYASAADKAMWAGWAREGLTTLAGYSSSGVPLLHEHMQSIDITQAANPGVIEMNHDVFASNPVMTEDMRQVLQLGSQRSPETRLPTFKLQRNRSGAQAYWFYEPVAAGR
ncbi:MAG: alpha/beta hydrolase [Caldimonas sp.]